jgi:transaldolase
MEELFASGGDLSKVASVASFFVSRFDTEVDRRLEEIDTPEALSLQGVTANANARVAYGLFLEQFGSDRYTALADHGARVQKPLWASTSTKNPAYRDTIYVEQLIGPQTVNTMPPATLEAFRSHGVTARTVDRGLAEAEQALTDLAAAGIDLDDVTDRLLAEGLASFQRSFDTLVAGIEQKSAALGRTVAAGR